MRRSEFHRAVDQEFGARANWVVADIVLTAYGITAAEALDAGVPPRDIWLAICDETELPPSARYRVGIQDARA
ncbi:DUF3046 domain-containing protein [Microbacterium indicum]|uniref:DUF3046 domain-containing protein n=1 Tax=Microbacterium indicum TaxID=358100 RepID=UPI0004072DE1|nr:DUF3046 domain-containing protein [Microbacterium indicum]